MTSWSMRQVNLEPSSIVIRPPGPPQGWADTRLSDASLMTNGRDFALLSTAETDPPEFPTLLYGSADTW